MSNIDEIIKLVQNKSIINTYVKFLKSCRQHVTTRHGEELNTVACRLWQLQYCLLAIIYEKNVSLITNARFLYSLCEYFFNFFTSESSPLYDFIAQNNLSHNLSSLYYRSNEDSFKTYISTNTNTYLCIYGINKSRNIIQDKGVVHYFTIINNGDEYFITSSWGSSHVCVPYSITKLDIDEFYTFCENLNYHAQDANSNTVNEQLKFFMKKYFLANLIQMRYSDDDIEYHQELRHQYIPSEGGIRREIDYLLKNEQMNFDVAIVTNYENLVKEIIDPQITVGGKINKYNKSRKRKSKKRKFRKRKSRKRKSLKLK